MTIIHVRVVTNAKKRKFRTAMSIKRKLGSLLFRISRSRLARMMQSRIGCLVSSVFFYVPAIMISPADINHPLWIVAIYFCVVVAVRVITHDFGATKNPALVKNPVWGSYFVFGVLQFIAGMLIFFSVITGGTNALWLVFVIIFGHFGRKNVAEIGHIFRRKQIAGSKAKQAYEQGHDAEWLKRDRDEWIKSEEEEDRKKEKAEEERLNEEAKRGKRWEF